MCPDLFHMATDHPNQGADHAITNNSQETTMMLIARDSSAQCSGLVGFGQCEGRPLANTTNNQGVHDALTSLHAHANANTSRRRETDPHLAWTLPSVDTEGKGRLYAAVTNK